MTVPEVTREPCRRQTIILRHRPDLSFWSSDPRTRPPRSPSTTAPPSSGNCRQRGGPPPEEPCSMGTAASVSPHTAPSSNSRRLRIWRRNTSRNRCSQPLRWPIAGHRNPCSELVMVMATYACTAVSSIRTRPSRLPLSSRISDADANAAPSWTSPDRHTAHHAAVDTRCHHLCLLLPFSHQRSSASFRAIAAEKSG